MSSIKVPNITEHDILTLIDECRKTAIKAHEASAQAIAEFNDAVEGLLAIARLTPPDEPGVMDLGTGGEGRLTPHQCHAGLEDPP